LPLTIRGSNGSEDDPVTSFPVADAPTREIVPIGRAQCDSLMLSMTQRLSMEGSHIFFITIEDLEDTIDLFDSG